MLLNVISRDPAAGTIEMILAKFGLSKPLDIVPLSNGLIHRTFFIKTAEGEFVLQKLHSIVNADTCRDAKAVTDYLNENNITVPTYLLTDEDKAYFEADDGTWRIMKKLPGTSISVAATSSHVYSAGAFLGAMHKTLKKLDYACIGSIPHFHDTPFIYEEFRSVITDKKHQSKLSEVRSLIEFILQEVPRQLLPQNVVRHIVHGDPKISNFLFAGDDVTAMLDFDTCLDHTPLLDVGDALRSWCNGTAEDDPEAAFKEELYEAAVAGYREKSELQPDQAVLIPRAFRLITIELAMRFLKDYFEDSYFAWNPQRFQSRMAHNLARAKGQISLYRQIENIA